MASDAYLKQAQKLTQHDPELSQRILWHLEINGANLCRKYKPAQLLALDDAKLIAGSVLEAQKAEMTDRMAEFETMVTEDFLADISVGGCVRCRFCKSDNVEVLARQTRKADEAATLFFTCADCQKRWKG